MAQLVSNEDGTQSGPVAELGESLCMAVVYPLPWPLVVGGVRCSRLWSPASFSVHLAGSAVTPAGSVQG